VVLVEKTGALGGMAAKLWKRQPFKTRAVQVEPEDNGVAETVARSRPTPTSRSYLNATIAKTDGAPGRFKVEGRHRIRRDRYRGRPSAPSSRPPASRLRRQPSCPNSAAASPNVVDQAGLEALAKAGQRRQADQAPPTARTSSPWSSSSAPASATPPAAPAYCSGHCCGTSIKQAMYFKDGNPDIDTVVLFTDLRTPGNGEDFYRAAQNKGVIFSKGVVSQVVPSGNACTVKFKDLILNEDTEAQADLVVLATGVVPNSGVNIEAAAAPAPAEAEAPAEGGAQVVATIAPESVLNLTYRQGPDMPQFKHGFNDSHFICFPYETRRTGIYAAGPVRRPMDILQARRTPPAPP
jgi:quinone-modifying oxidoreductase subunit QmoB